MRSLCPLLFLALALSGCSSDLRDAVASVDAGIDGYEGPVTPITEPYLLRLKEGPEFAYSITSMSNLGGATQRQTMVYRSKVSSDGDLLAWKTDVEEVLAKDLTLRSDSLPIITVRGRSTPRGQQSDIELDFPYFRERGLRIPEEASAEYRQFARAFESQSFELPEEPVGMGSVLMAPESLLKVFNLVEAMPGRPNKNTLQAMRRNTVTARVVGQTYDGGVHCIVARVTGGMEGDIQIEDTADSYSFAFDVRGHILVTTETGTVRRYVMAFDATMRYSGRSQNWDYFTELRPQEAASGAR